MSRIVATRRVRDPELSILEQAIGLLNAIGEVPESRVTRARISSGAEREFATTETHFGERISIPAPPMPSDMVRLQEARRLMVMEDMSIADASYRVGYESPSQFSVSIDDCLGHHRTEMWATARCDSRSRRLDRPTTL